MTHSDRTWTIDAGRAGKVTALASIPPSYDPERSSTIVLGHGAGAPQTHPFMVDIRRGLSDRGVAAVTFNFSYAEEGRKSPDPPLKLHAVFKQSIEKTQEELAPRRLFLGGKSLGGRMASHLAASGQACLGLVFFGYPLHPPNKPNRPRTEHWSDIPCPMLFLTGTRDALSNLELLRRSVGPLGDRATLHVITDADHSFSVLKRTGRDDADVRAELYQVAADWMATR